MQQDNKDRGPKRGMRQKENINENIRVRQIRVIYEEKDINELMNTSDALALAKADAMDLVEISSEGDVVVCKILDYGKFLYNREKKRKEAKKNQKQVLLKEIKLRPVTDVHDYNFKVKHAREFLEDGHRVKFSVRFRGRELGFKEGGRGQLLKVIEDTKDIARVDSGPTMEGRDMVMMLVSTVKK